MGRTAAGRRRRAIEVHPSDLAFATADRAAALVGELRRRDPGTLPTCLDEDATPDPRASSGLARLCPRDAVDREVACDAGAATLVVRVRVGEFEMTVERRGGESISATQWSAALAPPILGRCEHVDVMAIVVARPATDARGRWVVLDAVAHRHAVERDATGAARMRRASDEALAERMPAGLAIDAATLLGILEGAIDALGDGPGELARGGGGGDDTGDAPRGRGGQA